MCDVKHIDSLGGSFRWGVRMNSKSLVAGTLAVLGAVLCFPVVVSAASITVLNGNFESQNTGSPDPLANPGSFIAGVITDWNITGSGGAGVYVPTTGNGNDYASVALLNGPTVAYSNGSTISQSIGKLTAGVTYTLSVVIGQRNNYTEGGTTTYSAELYDDTASAPLGTFITGTATSPTSLNGLLAAFSYQYTAVAGVDQHNYSIRLAASNTQFNFDNVMLSDNTTQLNATAVPLPSAAWMGSALLTGGCLAAALRSRRRAI